jgi:diguanylate cyclase (GGDEF)-like protein
VQTGRQPPPRRPDPGDPSIRRTWWLLATAFLLLGLIAGLRLANSASPLDWLTVALVVIAAVAAIGHRNAVVGLEARGRGEAEGFARILRGLSHSVSAEAIVSAILDELVDATAADHVVLVRRRRDGSALEATLVSRRAGIPTATTALPLADLERPTGWPAPAPVAVPVEVPGPEAVLGAVSATPGPAAVGASPSPSTPERPARTQRGSAARGLLSRSSDHAMSRSERSVAIARRIAAETLALLRDLGLPLRDPFARGPSPAAEVLARGDEAAITERLAQAVRSVYGLSRTLTVPLRSGSGIAGSITLSRRDREPWSDATRRVLRGAAVETAAALERVDSYHAVEAQAATDQLTGLPNRRYFDEFCGLLARRRRVDDAIAVLMIDIDRFKRLNDTYGHPTGDEVLRAVGGAIAATVREEDVPARVGGEEFAVLLRNPGPGVAAEVGERVRQSVRDLDLSVHGVPGISVSVGVAASAGGDEPIPTIVERADRALLEAKRAGRDRVVAAG